MCTRPRTEDRTIDADERGRRRAGTVGGPAREEMAPPPSAQAWRNLELLYGG